MMRRLPILCLCAVLALVAGCRTPPAAPHADARAKLSIWCEFMPYADVIPTLPVLARYDCDLLLHVGPADIGDPALAELCREARRQKVNVSAWFLLPYEEHLYVGEETVDGIREASLRFTAWSQREDLGVRWLVFDCEPSPILGKRLFEIARRGRLIELGRTLRAERNPKQFQESVDRLNQLIDELHAGGMLVMGAGNRAFLDFLRHDNTAIQDALNAPFTMIHWDRASFITYRYKASQPQYVAMINRYAELANHYFGDRAALDLGLLGDQRGIPEHRERAELFSGGDQFMDYLDGMRSVHDLEEVAGVALGCGVRYINLYSLDGAVTSVAGLDRWLKAAAESRPATGWASWTPYSSAKIGVQGALFDGLFRSLVTRDVRAQDADSDGYSLTPTM